MRELSLAAFKLLNSVFKTKTAHFNGFLELDFKNKPKLKKQSFKRKKKMTSKQKVKFWENTLKMPTLFLIIKAM
ncbi:hypothetical protein FBE90_07390 [Campylobacter sp. CFSAN093244]|uniref:hypothetical protein n=1 Tax=Campylobacter coli TaxID=195 RepID=UPI001275C52A|nr:hypothetical protein [Campylobacter coli]EAK6246302.1 hypothetical protein [Campylobacter coli]NGY09513.1 hypothetical protein [Campylobacter coli]NGY21959.1 hypothetical protein [Campylobacter coli]